MTTFLGRATLVLAKGAEHRMSRVLRRKSCADLEHQTLKPV